MNHKYNKFFEKANYTINLLNIISKNNFSYLWSFNPGSW